MADFSASVRAQDTRQFTWLIWGRSFADLLVVIAGWLLGWQVRLLITFTAPFFGLPSRRRQGAIWAWRRVLGAPTLKHGDSFSTEMASNSDA